jgi:hypothetical protein
MKNILSFLFVLLVALIPVGLALLNRNCVYSDVKIECEGSVCAIQPTSSNEPIEFEALVFNPKSLNGEPIENSFKSSVVRIYYKDEKMEKINFVTIKNGNVMTSLSFDDGGMTQVVTSKLLGYEPFFILNKAYSGKYRLEEIRKNEDERLDSLRNTPKILRQPNPKSPYGQMSDKFQDSAFPKEIDSVLRKLNMLNL